MKYLLSIMVACACLTAAVSADEQAQKAIHYFVGDWSGDLDGSEYHGKATSAKDGKSVLEKGATIQADGDWCLKSFLLYEPGDRPNGVVIYYYNGNGAHFRTDAVVKPNGDFFEMTGKEAGLYADRGRETADYSFVIADKDHYTIKFTNRTVNGEQAPDQVFRMTRQPSK